MKKKLFENLPPRLENDICAEEEYLLDAFTHEKYLVMDFYKSNSGILVHMWRTVMNDREFANYDYGTKIWNSKNLENQIKEHGQWEWEGWRDPLSRYGMEAFHVEKETVECINNYIDQAGEYVYRKVGDSVRSMQSNITADNRETAKEKRFIRIQNKMNCLSAPPKDIRRFIMDKTYKNDHILYFGKNGAFCTRCGRRVEPKNRPEHNTSGTCPACRRKIIYKNTRYMKEPASEKELLYIQQDGDEIILRYFSCSLLSVEGKKEDLEYTEIVRTYHKNDLGWYEKRYINYYDHMTRECYWLNTMPRTIGYGNNCSLYTGNMEELAEILDGTWLKILSAWASEGEGMPLKEILGGSRHLVQTCERLHNAGLKKLAVEYARRRWEHALEGDGIELKKMLKISKPMMQHLREKDGGKKMLEILQDAYKNNRGLNDREIFELADAGIKVQEIAEVSRKNKIIKTLHYLQKTAGYKNLYITYTHYRDYLGMANSMGYDMDNGVRLYPKNLKDAHNKAASEFYQGETDKNKRDAIRKYPRISDIKKELDDTYGYRDGRYEIMAPRTAGDFIEEGRVLHHCVGGDNYMGNHNAGKRFILFMRKAEEPDTPYYTLEIEPETDRIIQYYGKYDKQPDKKEVDAFLKKWKEAVKRRKKKLQKAAG